MLDEFLKYLYYKKKSKFIVYTVHLVHILLKYYYLIFNDDYLINRNI